MKTKLITTAMVLGIAMSFAAAPPPQPAYKFSHLICSNNMVWIYTKESAVNMLIQISSLRTNQQFNFGALNKPYAFGITNGVDSFQYQQQELPRVHAEFDENHKREFNNQVVVEVPEAYELTNILLALTAYCQRDTDLIDKNKSYYREVQQAFSQWEGSPLVVALNKALEQDKEAYQSFRNSGFAYRFEFGKLVETTEYKNFNARLGIGSFKHQIEDFAERSGFRKFYNKHKAYYKSLVEAQRQWVNLKEMKTWMEGRISTQFNAYRVVLSPLVKNNHNVNTFSDENFSEVVLFAYAHDPTSPQKSTSLEIRYQLWQNAFTEMSRIYITPIVNKHTNDLNNTLSGLQNGEGISRSDDSGVLDIFNDYFIQSLFSLYMNDHMRAGDFTTVYANHKNNFVGKSDRMDFESFSDELLRLHRAGEKNMDELYTSMISWMKRS